MSSGKFFRNNRGRFAALWISLLLLLSVYSIVIVKGQLHIETNILSMLPDGDPDHNFINDAYSHYIGNLSQNVVFVVTHPDNDSAVQIASSILTLVRETPLFSTPKETDWYDFYFDYRYAMLSPELKAALAHEDDFFNQFKKYQYQKIMSPVSGFYGKVLHRDPLMLFPDIVGSFTSGFEELDYHDGKVIFNSPEETTVLVTVQINGNSFEEQTQEKFSAFLEQNSYLFSHQAEHIQYTGVIAYAREYLQRAKFESKLIGVLSSVAVLILLISVFRRFKTMLFGAVPILCGLLFGLITTFFLFDKIHIVSLTMGICLIGICVDYSFHYLSEFSFSNTKTWDSTDGLFSILPGITLGAFTSIIGYAVFLVVPFEGLKQTALFTISGLIGAYFTVVLLFPWCFSKRGKPVTSSYLFLTMLIDRYLRSFNSRTFKTIVTLASVVVLALGLSRISFFDGLEIFEMKTQELDSVQQRVASVTENRYGAKLLLIRADKTEELLLAVERADKKLQQMKSRGEISGFQTVTRYVPSLKTQKENIALLQDRFQTHKDSIEQFLFTIGFQQIHIDSLFSHISDSNEHFIAIDNWAQSSVSNQFRQLWIGELDGVHYSVAEVTLNNDTTSLKALTSDDTIFLINNREEFSATLRKLRQNLMYLIPLFYLLIFIILVVRYRLKRSLGIIVPPLASCLLTVALLSLFSFEITLMHILGLTLILGVGIDYTIFLTESKGDILITGISIVMSGLTTIFSFGLLVVSRTPALNAFGITIIIGIMLSLVFCPLAANRTVLPGDNNEL